MNEDFHEKPQGGLLTILVGHHDDGPMRRLQGCSWLVPGGPRKVTLEGVQDSIGITFHAISQNLIS